MTENESAALVLAGHRAIGAERCPELPALPAPPRRRHNGDLLPSIRGLRRWRSGGGEELSKEERVAEGMASRRNRLCREDPSLESSA